MENNNGIVSANPEEAAKSAPNGYVYKIERKYSKNEFTPFGAIMGWFKTDSNGNLVKDSYEENPHYDPRIQGKKFEGPEEYNKWKKEQDQSK